MASRTVETGGWRSILWADIATARRHLWLRFTKHVFVSSMFFFTTMVSVAMGVQMLYYLNLMDWSDTGVQLDRSLTAVIFFSVILGRAVMNTYRKLFEAGELLVIFALPVRPREVVWAKFLGNIIYSFVLFATLFVMVVFALIGLGHWEGIPLGIIAEGLILLVLGNAAGFVLPVILQCPNPARKAAYLVLAGAALAAALVLIEQPAREWWFYAGLGALCAAFTAAVPALEGFIIQGWLHQQSKPFRIGRLDSLLGRKSSILPQGRYLFKERLIARKDYLVLLRQRDMLTVLITSGILVATEFGMFYLMGPHEGFANVDPRYAKYLYPLFAGLGLFLAAVLQFALMGLASVGMEGKSLWILKSQPVEPSVIIRGKAMVILAAGLPVMVLVALPLAVMDGFPVLVALFFPIAGLAMGLAFTGAGLWMGAKLPNFDETMKYMPDLMAQFTMVFLCMILAGVFAGVPAAMLAYNHAAGVAAAAVSAGWAFVVLLWGMEFASRAYGRIQADEYL